MRTGLLVAACLCLTGGLALPRTAPGAEAVRAANASPFPLQLELRVPFAPTAFPSGGRHYVAYELYLTNLSPAAMTLRRIEVLDGDGAAGRAVATFEGAGLDSVLQGYGPQAAGAPSNRRILGAGETVVAFLWVSFERGVPVPRRLRHRVFTADSSTAGAVIGTRHTELHVLGPPVEGAGWTAADGPSNDPDNHHRRGVVVFDGRMVDSRRYAIDWLIEKNGKRFAGDARDRRAYYAYGKPVLAVADGTIVRVRDGLAENVPGHGDAFHPVVPITMDTVGGNTILLDLGGGQYAWYFHLQPGSIRVKRGERVRRGELLARVGCSGDAREPHVHFEVTNSDEALKGEGVPYVIDRFRVRTGDAWEARTRELPLDHMIVDFGEAEAR